jgi:hypothetical protein
MFDGFLNTAAFLEDFVAESIPAEKSFWVFGDHEAKCGNVHDVRLRLYRCVTIPF